MNTAKNTVEGFKLTSTPVDYQLTVHIGNWIASWVEANYDLRRNEDKRFKSYSKDTLVATISKLADDKKPPIYTRDNNPIAFRAQQLINHYGRDVVSKHIEAMWRQG